LLRVAADLATTTTTALTDPPARPLTLADLNPRAAASQSKQ